MTEYQLYAIIGSNVVAIAVVGGIFGTIFKEMQRLAEGQSHLEGARSAVGD